MVVSYHVSAGNGIQVLCQSNKCSSPLNSVSCLQKNFCSLQLFKQLLEYSPLPSTKINGDFLKCYNTSFCFCFCLHFGFQEAQRKVQCQRSISSPFKVCPWRFHFLFFLLFSYALPSSIIFLDNFSFVLPLICVPCFYNRQPGIFLGMRQDVETKNR